PFENDAIDRDLFSWPYSQFVADMNLLQRNVAFRGIRIDTTGGLWNETQQCFYCRACSAARTKFEHLAEKHQSGDHRGSFEINREASKNGCETIHVSSAGAEPDKREHVWTSVHNRSPRALK